MDDTRVWLSSRKTKRGKTYHLRWDEGDKRRSKRVGTDKHVAERARATMQLELDRGTYAELRSISWMAFVEEHVSTKSGKANAVDARRTLNELGRMMELTCPRDVSHGTIEVYVNRLADKGNSQATINKKLRYIRHALRKAVKRQYLAVCAMDGWVWTKVPKGTLRILKADEEPKLLASADELYGFPMHTFCRFLLTTWARFSEATKLQWDDVNLEPADAAVLFRNTKSVEHRWIPIGEPELVEALRRLQARTLKDGGPFVAYRDKSNVNKKWHAVVNAAGIPAITLHDLRRTGITRALLGNMPPVAVQKLAGHAKIETTMQYYVEVSKADLRAAVEKLHRSAG